MFSRRLLTRLFSTQPPRRTHFYEKPLTYIFLLLSYGSYKLYNWEYISPRLQRALKQNLDNFAQPTEFQGVHRENLISEVLNLCSKYITIIFAPRFYGKTYFLHDLQSSIPGTVLLTCDSNIIKTMDSLSFPIKFKEDRFDDFLTAVEFLLKKQEKPLLLIDSIEKLPEDEKKMLNIHIKKWNKKLACRVVIASNDCELVNETRKYFRGDVFIMPQLTNQEIHQAVKDLPGYSFEDVEMVVESCVGALDFVLDMMKSGKKAKEYLDEKELLIQGHISELVLDDEAKELLFNIVTSVQDLSPLGDLYSEIPLSQDLISRGIMQRFPNGSSKFRNYFTYKAISNYYIMPGPSET